MAKSFYWKGNFQFKPTYAGAPGDKNNAAFEYITLAAW